MNRLLLLQHHHLAHGMCLKAQQPIPDNDVRVCGQGCKDPRSSPCSPPKSLLPDQSTFVVVTRKRLSVGGIFRDQTEFIMHSPCLGLKLTKSGYSPGPQPSSPGGTSQEH